MNSVNIGDLVQISKGELTHQERAVGGAGGTMYLPNFEGQPTINYLVEVGYAVEVVEKAKPQIPAEDGVYLDIDKDIWVIEDGVLTYFSPENNDNPYANAPIAEWYLPFTKLTGVTRK